MARSFPSIVETGLTNTSLLSRYSPEHNPSLEGSTEHYTDCFTVEISKTITLAEFIQEFYTSRAFRPERILLGIAPSFRASNRDVQLLASGASNRFSAWTVEDRLADQILLKDAGGRTRSWLMTEVDTSNSTQLTSLHFGSAVLPVTNKRTGKHTLGSGFQLLQGFHRTYSKLLLASAARKLARSPTISSTSLP